MHLKRSSGVAPRRELIDAVLDGYVTWREESAAVEATYRDWRHAAPRERELAFDGYVAALDREEDAAAEYRRLIERVAAV
jgi:hypothetical protein